jgi:hypothetical protein
MATPAAPDILMPSILSLGAYGALLLLLTLITASWQTGLARFLIFGFAALLTWKQGFVRAGYSHIIVVPLTLEIMAILILTLTIDETRFQATTKGKFHVPLGRPFSLVLSTALFCAVIGASSVVFDLIRRSPGYSILGSPSVAFELFKGRLQSLKTYPGVKKFQEDKFLQAKHGHALKKFSEIVKNDTVDVFGDEAAIALFNDWNYHPRPSVQSFAAYTAFLEARDADFVKGEDAPEFYVWKSQPIDSRLLPETDGPALLAILDRYSPVATESGFWLFRKDAKAEPMPPRPSEASGLAAWGKSIRFDPLPAGAVDEIKISLRPTLLGKLLSKQAWVTLQITQKSGNRSDFRVPRLLGELGFVVNPPISSDLDLYSILFDDKVDSLQSLSVVMPDQFKSYFKPEFSYRIRHLEKAIEVHKASGLMAALVGFDAEPHDLESMGPRRIYSVEDRDVLFVHAPSRFLLDVPASANTLTGAFGVMPGAFETVPQQKQVKFKVTAVSKAGRVTLLDASQTESKMASFSAKLQPGLFRSLEFSANCTPTCDGGWSYWSTIRFGRGDGDATRK